MIIKDAGDLKNPIIAYSVMMKYNAISGEDFVDYNDDIVNGWPFAMWLLGKGYITSEQLENLVVEGIKNFPSLQDVLFDGTLFPITYGHGLVSEMKAYAILAEYMTTFSLFRGALYEAISDASDKFEGGFYKDENGVSLACILDDSDTKSNFWILKDTKEGKRAIEDLTLREQYLFVQNLSLDEADNYIE